MNKILKKWYVVVLLICIIGFSIGFLCNQFFMEEASASRKDDKYMGHEVMGYEDIFSENVYRSTRNETTGVVNVAIKNEPDEENMEEVYTKKDARMLTGKMLGEGYELKLISSSEYGVMYEEYKDGYPTGGLASYSFDNDGNIVEARFREGHIYDVDESAMISYEDAYEIAIEEILNKYGKDTEIKGTMEDYEYRIYYNPEAEILCYEILELEGYMPSMAEVGIDSVYFYVTVSLDGVTIVEVASTLGY